MDLYGFLKQIKVMIINTFKFFCLLFFFLYLTEACLLLFNLLSYKDGNIYQKRYDKIKIQAGYNLKDNFKKDFFNKNSGKKFFLISPNYYYEKNENTYFPLSGISKSHTYLCSDFDYSVDFISDRYGFRNDDRNWDKEIETVILGDSHSIGMCYLERDSFVNYFDTQKTINLSYPGHGTLMQYAALKEYTKDLEYKSLYLFYSEANDIQEMNNSLNNHILKNYFDINNFTQNLKTKQTLIDKESSLISKTLLSKFNDPKQLKKKKKFNFEKLLKLGNLRNMTYKKTNQMKEINYKKKDLENFRDILSKINDEAKKKNAKFLFVYLPEWSRYNFKDLNTETYRDYNKIKKIVNELNIEFLDFKSSIFDKEIDPLKLFPFKGASTASHYSPNASNLIKKKLQEN